MGEERRGTRGSELFGVVELTMTYDDLDRD